MEAAASGTDLVSPVTILMIKPQILNKSQDELLVEVGRALCAGDLTALPQTPQQLKNRASRWIDANWETIKSRICSNKDVRQLAKDGFSAELATAVLAMLESLSLGTSVTPLAVLLCKRGLQKICSDCWDKA